MQVSPRAVVAAFTVAPLLLIAACGGSSEEGPDATLARIQPTSFVEIPPATTTTTTTLPADAEDSGVAQGEQTYTIRSGDTLGGIASRFGVPLDTLVAYNQFPDGTSQLILPGDQIRIPPGASIPGSGSETADDGDDDTADSGDGDGDGDTDGDGDGEASGDCPTTYTIKAGDNTRIGVAERFGITFQEMDAANTNTPGYENFVVGTPITIPCP